MKSLSQVFLFLLSQSKSIDQNLEDSVYPMTSRCNTPPFKGGDNNETSLDNSSKLSGSINPHLVRFIDVNCFYIIS